MAVRQPEVGLRLAQVDATLLANAVRSVDDSPHALLTRDAHHLLPRQQCARVRYDCVDDRDDLVPLPPCGLVVPWGQRRHVRERGTVLLLDLAQLRAETLEDLRVRERAGVGDVRVRWARLLGAVGEVVDRVRDGAIGRRSCGDIGALGSEGTSEVGRRTADDNVSLAPFEVAENRVQRVRRVRDEDHFVQLSPDELRNGLPEQER